MPSVRAEPVVAREALAALRDGHPRHHRLGARAADPAGDGTVRPDQCLRARLGRRRPLAPDDRGERERLATAPEVCRQRE